MGKTQLGLSKSIDLHSSMDSYEQIETILKDAGATVISSYEWRGNMVAEYSAMNVSESWAKLEDRLVKSFPEIVTDLDWGSDEDEDESWNYEVFTIENI